MAEKIGLWVGFSIHFYTDKTEGGEVLHISGLSRGPVRDNPEAAWADAVRLGQEGERYLKSKAIRPIGAQEGIAPAHLLV